MALRVTFTTVALDNGFFVWLKMRASLEGSSAKNA
jgi:hypothetical protein